ncbi:Type I restriction-modification system%2C DNA-methyltransferase subunit M [Campylobacter hyointestinalis]|uniref:HsdM family class I SAM-dependent methyltransferase n=1 Tax=Campylobacter hyointestinalis TaxID=198 RepID=UPI00072AD1DD|nr:N-6 DNA methylase [Campylobacter hyointestinalis]PPB55254.1 SAM-dependent methyltransferase [Campylobacter hyointestinalis subsp. hyointestinalis]PPB60860.1 SAM-dependent methyltransferase [Campylobacter hyointestinalis subsp. hyointestinalis]PPB64092.1 SAM-dependent methyltransferase [Campylobacter hyointestinalis subsp. hyointestinalis]PPB68333.1 SAM-dependent methyltransferase [Campylobacter hyointestinalis subsp. hyointestinalis]PPB70663.1 SAM-dependent methyltransferase [Campylobacter 
MANWLKEPEVDNFVKEKLKSLGLEYSVDFRDKSASAFLTNALRGASKTKNETTNPGIPDFTCEKYALPVLIESKLGLKKLEKLEEGTLKFDQKSIQDYALNGVIHYAKHIIKNNSYSEVIAIGVAGDNSQNVEIKIAWVYGANEYQILKNKDFSFLENEAVFNEFYENEALLSDEKKHEYLLKKRDIITKHAKALNKIMNDLSISAHERALYVASCLLAQQNILSQNGENCGDGLVPDNLKGSTQKGFKDSEKIFSQIEKFLSIRNLDAEKTNLMLGAFNRICINELRDKPKDENHKLTSKFLKENSSVNKQIFTYIYENIFKEIKNIHQNSKFYDVMGELYNEFLKYAMSDGKMGIVLTPFYIAKMMTQILEINQDSKVLDLATGSAGFLIAAMDTMINDAKNPATKKAKNQMELNEKIKTIKKSQLLGIEENTDMYALATTNMILRGDGSSQIIQNDSFDNALTQKLKDFGGDRILLNPPFSYKENGMPFIKRGLDNMPKGSLGAIIIQDSAGSGKAINTNKEILKSHTLLASIKMPTDLFVPMAGVQTSIYVFKAGTAHNFDKTVRFIDFRNDGYKRSERVLQETDSPKERYEDIINIYLNGTAAKLKAKWDLSEILVDDYITPNGNDWNFDQHKKIDTKPNLEDFKKCVSDYLAWEVANIIKNETTQNLNQKDLL